MKQEEMMKKGYLVSKENTQKIETIILKHKKRVKRII